MDSQLVSLIRAIAILQGLILGIILIVYSRKNKSSLFLGLFLLGFAIEFLPGLISDMKFLNYNARQLLFLLNLSWILFPLILIYVRKVSIVQRERVRYRVIYPGILAVLFQVILGLNRNLSNFLLEQTYTYEALYAAGLVYSVYILYRIHRHLQQHKQEVHNQYAQIDNRLLLWIRYFAFFCFALVTTRITALFMERSPVLHLVLAALNIVIITVIAISGFYQYNVINVLSKSPQGRNGNNNNSSNTSIPENRAFDLLKRMDELLGEKELYQQQDLTIANVAEQLKEHPRSISVALNTYYKRNFNSYINQYRIRKAEALLKAGYTKSKSIEGLSQEVGFRSKASFYRAFKENTDITPVDYIKKLDS